MIIKKKTRNLAALSTAILVASVFLTRTVYKLNLPGDAPAEKFMSIMVYDS